MVITKIVVITKITVVIAKITVVIKKMTGHYENHCGDDEDDWRLRRSLW